MLIIKAAEATQCEHDDRGHDHRHRACDKRDNRGGRKIKARRAARPVHVVQWSTTGPPLGELSIDASAASIASMSRSVQAAQTASSSAPELQ